MLGCRVLAYVGMYDMASIVAADPVVIYEHAHAPKNVASLGETELKYEYLAMRYGVIWLANLCRS